MEFLDYFFFFLLEIFYNGKSISRTLSFYNCYGTEETKKMFHQHQFSYSSTLHPQLSNQIFSLLESLYKPI